MLDELDDDPYLVPKKRADDPNRTALADPRVKDFLDRIGKSEGADYNTLVGGRRINDLSRHPNIVGLTTSAGPSTAFGKYQIVGTTNRTKLRKYADLDYSPENQDLRAVELLRQTKALDALQADDPDTALRRAGREWASLPGSPLPGRKNHAAFATRPQDPYLVPKSQPERETSQPSEPTGDPYLIANPPEPIDSALGATVQALQQKGAEAKRKRNLQAKVEQARSAFAGVKGEVRGTASRPAKTNGITPVVKATPRLAPETIVAEGGYVPTMPGQPGVSRDQTAQNELRRRIQPNADEYKNFLLMNRAADSPRMKEQFLDLRVKQELERGSAESVLATQDAEAARQQRVARMSTTEKLAQAPKSAVAGLTRSAGTSLKGVSALNQRLGLLSVLNPFGSFDAAVDYLSGQRSPETTDRATYQLGKAITEIGRDNPLFKSNPDLEQEFLVGKTPETVGQVAAMMMGGWATGAPKAAVAILGSTMTAGDTYDEVRALGGSDEDATFSALLAGGILGPTELIGMRGAMKAIAGTSKEATLRAAMKTALKEGRRDAIENAAQEMGQEFGQGIITENPRSSGQLLEAGALGAIGGTATVPLTLATQSGGRRAKEIESQTNRATEIDSAVAPSVPPVTTSGESPVSTSTVAVGGRPLEVIEPSQTTTPNVPPIVLEAERRQVQREFDKIAETSAGQLAETPVTPTGEPLAEAAQPARAKTTASSPSVESLGAERRASERNEQTDLDYAKATAEMYGGSVAKAEGGYKISIKGTETKASTVAETVAKVRDLATQQDLIDRAAKSGKALPREEVIQPSEQIPTKEVAPNESTEVASERVGSNLKRGEAGVAPDKPTTPAEPSTTSARKDQFAAEREALDLPELPAAERKAWQQTLNEARQRGIEKASLLADEVLNKSRALDDVETGQIVLRAQEIKNQHAEVMKEIGRSKDADVISAKASQRNALEGEFDKLTKAAKTSGTEKGRALAAQKLTINQDYDLVSVVQRAKAERGGELKPEERAKFEQQAARISELETKLAEAEKAAEAKTIQKDIERVRRQIKRGETKQVLDDEFAALRSQFAQARAEVKNVQPAGLAGLDPEGTLTPLILKMARNRVRAGTVKVEEVIDQIHGAIVGHVDVSRDEIRTLLSGHNLERDPLPAIKTRLSKQESELTRMLETRDFSRPPTRKKPIYDKESSDLKARVESLKRRVDREIRGTDSKLEVALAMWKAGLLTGPKTHVRNVGGTAGFQAFEEVSRIPGSVADLITSAFTGRRTLGGPDPVAVAKSSYEAATKGVREAKHIMKYGATSEELKIIERPRELNSGSKIIDTYVNTVFRTLGAEDKIFRTYAYKRSLLEQAKLKAKSEGKAAKDLEHNPTAEMVSQAILDSEVATFNNQNPVATSAEWVRQHSGPVGKTAIDFIVPFRRTPSNIMVRLLESTPLGLVKGSGQLIRDAIKKEFDFEAQRKFSQTIGRSVTGSSLIALGAMLASKGWATGLFEEDRGAREIQKAAGRSPMSLRLGDTWHGIGSFSPIGNLIAIGAALYQEKNRPPKEGEEPPNILAAALPVTLKTTLEQPMLRGMSSGLDAIKEPGTRGEAFVGQLAGSAVPTIVSNVAETIDNKRRESRGIIARVKSRVPFLRSSLPEDIDVFGRPRESRRTGMVDPTLTSSANDEPFIKELVRLDVGVVKTNRKPGEDGAKYRERIIAQGKEMAKKIAKVTSSPRYQSRLDDDKRKVIKDAIEEAREGVNKKFRLSKSAQKMVLDRLRERANSGRVQ